MSSQGNSVYQNLFKAYQQFNCFDSGTTCQEKFNDMRAEAKKLFENDKDGFSCWVDKKFLEYQRKNSVKKSTSILNFMCPRNANVSKSVHFNIK